MIQHAIYELDSVSTVVDQAPGLIGPDELANWEGNLDFTDGSVEVYVEKSGIIPAASSHPCLSLLDFPPVDISRLTLLDPSAEGAEQEAMSVDEGDAGELENMAYAVDEQEVGDEEEDSPLEDTRSVASEPESLEGQDPARRDEECAVDSDGSMPPLADESDTESSSGSSDHHRGESTTVSEATSERRIRRRSSRRRFRGTSR